MAELDRNFVHSLIVASLQYMIGQSDDADAQLTATINELEAIRSSWAGSSEVKHAYDLILDQITERIATEIGGGS